MKTLSYLSFKAIFLVLVFLPFYGEELFGDNLSRGVHAANFILWFWILAAFSVNLIALSLDDDKKGEVGEYYLKRPLLNQVQSVIGTATVFAATFGLVMEGREWLAMFYLLAFGFSSIFKYRCTQEAEKYRARKS